ncbi:hypothetical protein N5U00_07535 [Aliarcobacter butzleri]|uniref:Chemotaxis protein n=5 Tax=root TaxID=1 RepID=A8EW65_ALIB4|nr:hypothetical protein [Aliarcobacter butzleri]ABV68188.1 conserved hypothetical protein [Aliarcobacter butzleri RM4018]AGR78154.1 hypothetical protein A7H1H_1902 [Aliarcobacter butzleri 7h1h]KLE05204.1 hypothetical protein AF77_05610 [Aliarcobacter butzleri L352]KLE05259.1 hypothetical protein AF78_05725 [Aliarcobacter butzleri L353]BAK71492.1 conserved hypothetical protein [Aliarcobacter butzleri ED-1]
MSMSQEDIEALMSGLDIASDGNSEQTEEAIEPAKVNTKEIEELLSQTEEIKDKDDTTKVQESIETSVANIPNEDNANKNNKINEIENLLNDIEINSPKELVSSSENVKKIQDDDKSDRTEDEIVKDWTSSKINEGVFPFPAESDTKVVTQLSQVANDSEEKVSQIFDVLSLGLDNNNELRKAFKEYDSFITAETNLLVSLNNKFPNIKIFDEHLKNIHTVKDSLEKLKALLNDEDMHIFQGMELMQFNDINRQKIERVMSVIRKLSIYLNNLFEDDGKTTNLPMAKHIHGDETEDLVGDDLDKLIAEFSQKD